jgi:hypothetical protein
VSGTEQKKITPLAFMDVVKATKGLTEFLPEIESNQTVVFLLKFGTLCKIKKTKK